jgi:subtilisin family serine protease
LNAVCVWKVNLINLSIGFELHELKDPERRILNDTLDFAKRSKVVIFAAASNSGNREELAYPASERDLVFCMNSTDGNGNKSWFNPQHQKRRDNFSILGEHVLSTWLQDDVSSGAFLSENGAVWKRDRGTSVACTIAVCVAALVYQFGRQYAVDRPDKLETFAGVAEILGMMSSTRTSDGFYDIVPWELFNSKDSIIEIKTLIDMRLKKI